MIGLKRQLSTKEVAFPLMLAFSPLLAGEGSYARFSRWALGDVMVMASLLKLVKITA